MGERPSILSKRLDFVWNWNLYYGSLCEMMTIDDVIDRFLWLVCKYWPEVDICRPQQKLEMAPSV